MPDEVSALEKDGAVTLLLRDWEAGKPDALDRLFEAVSRAYDGDLQMVDSSSIRVHQHAANVKKGMRRQPPLGTSLHPDAWGARGAG